MKGAKIKLEDILSCCEITIALFKDCEIDAFVMGNTPTKAVGLPQSEINWKGSWN